MESGPLRLMALPSARSPLMVSVPSWFVVKMNPAPGGVLLPGGIKMVYSPEAPFGPANSAVNGDDHEASPGSTPLLETDPVMFVCAEPSDISRNNSPPARAARGMLLCECPDTSNAPLTGNGVLLA